MKYILDKRLIVQVRFLVEVWCIQVEKTALRGWVETCPYSEEISQKDHVHSDSPIILVTAMLYSTFSRTTWLGSLISSCLYSTNEVTSKFHCPVGVLKDALIHSCNPFTVRGESARRKFRTSSRNSEYMACNFDGTRLLTVLLQTSLFSCGMELVVWKSHWIP